MGVFGGIGSWALVSASAISLGAAPAQVPPKQQVEPPGLQVAQYTGNGQASYVPAAASGWETYKVRLATLALNQGVRQATIQANVPNLTISQRVIDMERNEPIARTSSGGVPMLAPYLRRHVSPTLIRRGQSNYSNLYGGLRAIQARWGVDPTVLLAIYGHETSYGLVTGNHDLLQVLASLGYYGRRRDLFEGEFVSALKLMDQGVPRRRLKGSWAGATGFPQFLPSVALRLRADGDSDGYADIWSSELDGLASIANYLRDAGWKPNVPWGVAVRTPSSLNRAAITTKLASPRCPQVYKRHSRWLTMREWRALGVTPLGRGLPDNEMASLIEPDGPYATAYLLTTNYRTILDYNCSNFYAISVGVLADAIARR